MRKFAVVVALLSLCLASLAWAEKAESPSQSTPPAEAKPAPAPRQSDSIAWHDYEEALALAKDSKKVTLVEFRAEWCHWCKKMEKEVYTQRDVIALGDRVVFAKVDEAKRRDLIKQYSVRGLPTAVILDRNGREIKRIVGYKTAPELVTEVRQALQK